MSTLYIRLQTGFFQHRKTLRLRSLIGESAFWVPPRLWAWAADNQADGNLSDYSDGEIAELIGYTGNASIMRQALIKSGFIDPDGMIHGWDDHNGFHSDHAERARRAANARWEKLRSQKDPPPAPPQKGKDRDRDRDREKAYAEHMLKHDANDAQADAKAFEHMPQASKSAKTPTNSTNPTPSCLEEVKGEAQRIGLPEREAEAFWNYHEAGGWRVGKNPMKKWTSALQTWKANQDKFGGGKVSTNGSTGPLDREGRSPSDPLYQYKETWS